MRRCVVGLKCMNQTEKEEEDNAEKERRLDFYSD